MLSASGSSVAVSVSASQLIKSVSSLVSKKEVTAIVCVFYENLTAYKICHFVGLKKEVTAIVCVFYEKRLVKR